MQVTVPPTTAVPPPPHPASLRGRVERPRHLQIAAFIAALAWYFCAKALASSAANGLSARFDVGMIRGLLEALFQVFLLVVGLGLLAAIERRRAPLRLTLGLPDRKSARIEWSEGVALGWGMAVAAVLPLLLGGALNVRFWSAPRAWELTVLNLVVLSLFTLAHTLGIYGYALQRLIEAVGPTRATIVIALLAALYAGLNPNFAGPTGIRITVAFVATVLLCLCWIRTHALWLMWGLDFAWSSAIAILFGLPLAGSVEYSSVVETRAFGPPWLTGGSFGPGAGIVTAICILSAIVVLIRITSDYAWNYTHPPIIPAGYEVNVPPPAAHAAMESAPPPPPLIQILPTTPTGASSAPGSGQSETTPG